MKQAAVRLQILFLSAFFVSCASGSFMDLSSLKTQLKIKSFPVQKDYPESDGVVLYELHDVHLNVTEDYDLETVDNVTRVVRLFKHLNRHATITIEIPSWDKLTNLSARTVNPDGKVIPLSNDDFHRVTGTGGNEVEYSDAKSVTFTFPAVEENSIIEYSYSLYSPYAFLQAGWMIQGSMPKLENIYRLTTSILVLLPPERGGLGWNWRYQWHNCDLGEPTFTRNLTPSKLTREQTVTYEWVQKDIPPFRSEPMMPPASDYLQYVEFAPADWKTWNDVSAWYNKNYFAPQLVTTEKIARKAASLVAGSQTETQKIGKIYRFVEGLRYVAIELGEGGYRPNFPQTVLERGYGDCKDKSILLISLLRSEKIEAKPVLLLTTDEGSVNPKFPSWDFNHMIVKVTTRAGRVLWLDPTVNYCRPGEIPYADQGANALVLNDDNTSTLESIPRSNYKDNKELVDMDIDLKSPTDAIFHIAITYKGEYNYSHRDMFSQKTRDQMFNYCKSLIADDYLNAEVTNYSLSNLDSVDSALTLRFDVKVPNAVTRQGDLVFLHIDPFKLSDDWSWLGESARRYNIEFNFPSTIEKKIQVTYPAGKYEIRNLPDDSILQTDGLYYEKDYHKDSTGKITAGERLEVRSKILKVQDLDKIKNFVQAMQSKIREQVILKAD